MPRTRKRQSVSPTLNPEAAGRSAGVVLSSSRSATSIYLPAAEARRLKLIAADEGVKLNDLFLEGIAYVLSRRPDVDHLAGENRRLLIEAEADRSQLAALTSKVNEIQTDLETALHSADRWKKGADRPLSKLFWDGVLARAADVLRGRGPKTAAEILAGLPESTRSLAADRGTPLTAPELAHIMSRRARAGKVFVEANGKFGLKENEAKIS